MLIIQFLCPPVVSNHQYPHLCSMYLLLVLLLFMCFLLFSVCLPAAVLNDSSPGVLAEAVGCFLFSLSTDEGAILQFCLAFFIVFSYHFFVPLSHFPFFFFAVLLPLSSRQGSALICIKYFNKNK